MGRNEARAEHIRALEDGRPDMTWEEIADDVGVSPRAAQEWPKSGAITAKNARKLAELFDKPFDWLWHEPSRLSELEVSALGQRLVALDQRLAALDGLMRDPSAALDRIKKVNRVAGAHADLQAS